MRIDVSVGEIVDKLSILEIKKNNISDRDKLVNINSEFEYLYSIVFNDLLIDYEDFSGLVLINEELWKIEDRIRIKERRKIFPILPINLELIIY